MEKYPFFHFCTFWGEDRQRRGRKGLLSNLVIPANSEQKHERKNPQGIHGNTADWGAWELIPNASLRFRAANVEC